MSFVGEWWDAVCLGHAPRVEIAEKRSITELFKSYNVTINNWRGVSVGVVEDLG
jgi:hypothetical protein